MDSAFRLNKKWYTNYFSYYKQSKNNTDKKQFIKMFIKQYWALCLMLFNFVI